MMQSIRLAVIDDHPLFREGVTRSLSEFGDFEVVGEGSTTDDAVQIAASRQPDILLLDISMPGGGINAIARILERHPTQKVVMLTVSESGRDIAEALNRGAKGFILKGVGSRSLAEILRAVAAGESYLSPALSAKLLSDLSSKPQSPLTKNPISQLTDRESGILKLVASGLSNKHIARQLSLHEKTVKHHMTRILAKLNATNRTEAAMLFRDASEMS